MRLKQLLFSAVAVLVIAGPAYASANPRTLAYKQAVNLYENGMYERARAIFGTMQGDPMTDGYSVLCALKVFDLPWVMFGSGMPENQGWLLGTYMYDQTFKRMNVDYGSTIAVLIVVLGVVLSNVANRVFRRSDDI